MRLHSIGVRLSETRPETSTALTIVTANSWSRRPMMPPMNTTGMNTAASDSVIDTIVKPISLRAVERRGAARSLPISMCRAMFSSITIASSTTKPTDSVSAISDRLSMLKPSAYMTANVPTIDIGSASDGMIVADTLRRNTKMTMTTSPSASSRLNFTSRNRFADALRAVVDHAKLGAGRQRSLERRQHRLDVLDDLDRVRARLLLDREDDAFAGR